MMDCLPRCIRGAQLGRANMALLLVIAACTIATTPAPAAAQEDLEQLEAEAMKAAVAGVAPSVVRIETFGGLEKVGDLLVGSGPTTGLIVAEDGYVISSAFNFAQQPTSILVTLPGGERAAAKVVAEDRSRMLVLLKVDSEKPLPVPPSAPRSELRVGQWSIAVGRTFEQDQVNVSVGVLSALHRIWNKAIQTDAKVSPSNYGGPLIDIRGRVIGVLVPLSPEGQGEVAGAEWYDSGIGFAVPMEDILQQLESLKGGEDLKPGILGIALKGDNIYADEAIVAVCQARSPAAEAGLQVDDKIVEINGQPIERQAQLKHALGPLYAGQQVTIAVMRDGKRLEVTAELTDELEPYAHPFLGILPLRPPAVAEDEVRVRYVYPGSPAGEAGVKPQDKLLEIGGQATAGVAAAQAAIATLQPGEMTSIKIERDGQTQQLQVTLAELPTAIPEPLPAAHEAPKAPMAEQPPTGVVEIKVPEEANECLAYVPEDYHADLLYGMLVVLPAPGQFERDAWVARWKPLCEQHDVIVVTPRPADPEKWQPTEVAFIRKAIDNVLKTYQVDPTRVVVHGHQAGGAMAYLVAFSYREAVRGVSAVDVPLPLRMRVPENEPLQRLAVHVVYSDDTQLAERIASSVEQLKEKKFPVTKVETPEPRYLNDQELAELVRWLDTLDRI